MCKCYLTAHEHAFKHARFYLTSEESVGKYSVLHVCSCVQYGPANSRLQPFVYGLCRKKSDMPHSARICGPITSLCITGINSMATAHVSVHFRHTGLRIKTITNSVQQGICHRIKPSRTVYERIEVTPSQGTWLRSSPPYVTGPGTSALTIHNGAGPQSCCRAPVPEL